MENNSPQKGVSHNIRHLHKLVTNQKRTITTGSEKTCPKPKSYREVCMKEFELMIQLETERLGKHKIANKICQYLRRKINKQVRDKRA
jgi:hypothetical protein